MKKKNEKFSEKVVKFGVGSIFLAKEGIDKLMSEVDKKGSEHVHEVSEFQRDVKDTVRKGKETVKKAAKQVLKSAGVATVDDMEELKKDIGGVKKTACEEPEKGEGEDGK